MNSAHSYLIFSLSRIRLVDRNMFCRRMHFPRISYRKASTKKGHFTEYLSRYFKFKVLLGDAIVVYS